MDFKFEKNEGDDKRNENLSTEKKNWTDTQVERKRDILMNLILEQTFVLKCTKLNKCLHCAPNMDIS